MPAISREPPAPSKLMDVVRCSCKAEGNVCSGGVAMDPMECRVSVTVSARRHACCNPPTHPEEDE